MEKVYGEKLWRKLFLYSTGATKVKDRNEKFLCTFERFQLFFCITLIGSTRFLLVLRKSHADKTLSFFWLESFSCFQWKCFSYRNPSIRHDNSKFHLVATEIHSMKLSYPRPLAMLQTIMSFNMRVIKLSSKYQFTF